MTPSASLLTSAFAQLAGFAFAQLRAVTDLAGSVLPPAHPDRRLMVQPGPRAVTLIQFGSRPPVQISHCGSLRVEDLSTTGALQRCFTAGPQIVHRSHTR